MAIAISLPLRRLFKVSLDSFFLGDQGEVGKVKTGQIAANLQTVYLLPLPSTVHA